MKYLTPHTIIWTAVALLFSPILWLLYRSRWDVIDYGHAYFILPVSLYLVWSRREELMRSLDRPVGSGALIAGTLSLFAGMVLFVFGWRFEYLSVSTISAIPLLFGILIWLHGPSTAKECAFPILYLLLLVPPPAGVLDAVTLPMRYQVSIATEKLLAAFNYPITRDGLLLMIGGQQVYLGEACSGFRSLITLSSLGLAYIYLSKNSFLKKTLLAVSIVPLALLGNFIRVTAVVLVTYYVGVNKGQEFFHDFSGFVMFAVMLFGLIGLDGLLAGRRKPSSHAK